MSIKKEVKWDPKNEKFVGTVDYGSITAEETDTIATNALVIMISGLKKPWYVPLGYFLTNKLKWTLWHCFNVSLNKGKGFCVWLWWALIPMFSQRYWGGA